MGLNWKADTYYRNLAWFESSKRLDYPKKGSENFWIAKVGILGLLAVKLETKDLAGAGCQTRNFGNNNLTLLKTHSFDHLKRVILLPTICKLHFILYAKNWHRQRLGGGLPPQLVA